MVEKIKFDGTNLVNRVKKFAKQGNVRRMRIIAENGDVFLDTPLNIGLVAGGVVTLAAPWLAILGAVAVICLTRGDRARGRRRGETPEPTT